MQNGDVPQSTSRRLSIRAASTLVTTVVLVGAACVASVLLAPAAQRSEALTKMIGLFISWPFVAGLLGVTFGFTFREQISVYILRARIKLPGGTEIESLQPKVAAETKSEAVVEAVAIQAQSNEELEKLRISLDSASKDVQDKDAQIRWLADGLNVKNRLVGYWKAQYFDVFLAQRTKDVLGWLAKNEPLTETAFHELWTPFIPDEAHRRSILAALFDRDLIERRGAVFTISDTGRTYLEAQAAWETLSLAPEGKHEAAQNSWFDALARLGATGV